MLRWKLPLRVWKHLPDLRQAQMGPSHTGGPVLSHLFFMTFMEPDLGPRKYLGLQSEIGIQTFIFSRHFLQMSWYYLLTNPSIPPDLKCHLCHVLNSQLWAHCSILLMACPRLWIIVALQYVFTMSWGSFLSGRIDSCIISILFFQAFFWSTVAKGCLYIAGTS